MENYEVITKLGSGACGAVYLVSSHINHRHYALKKVQLDEQKRTRTREALLREARILAKLKHPHIVVYHDSFFADADDLSFMHIVQDYCDGGTLDDKIISMKKKQQYFDESTIMEWFIQIAMAVQYIHSHKILHRDLKAQNVFMTKTDGVKLGDFGIAKVLDNTLDAAVTCVGTPCYLSPELCQDIPYSSKSDIWALGCLLFELCALKPAFDANNLISLFYKITKSEYAPLPDHFSVEIKQLIAAILIKDADARPSASAILNMTTVRNYLETFIQDREYLLKQKIITLRAKASTRSGNSSPISHSRAQLRGEDLATRVRQSTPVIHSRLMASLPPLRRSHQPPSTPTHAPSHTLSPSAVDSSLLPTTYQGNVSDMESPTEKEDGKGGGSPSYSDDFDSTPGSSAAVSEVSDGEEVEIPEELSADVDDTEYTFAGKQTAIDNINTDFHGTTTATARSTTATTTTTTTARSTTTATTATITSVDAVDADVQNNSSYYDDDFEDDSEAEELDDIITKAKQAHILPVDDEYFIDENHDLSPHKQTLKQYLEILGADLSTKD